MRSRITKQIALGGMLAAAALTLMCMGGMVPLATYICPMLCIVAQFLVLRFCGTRIAWAWYVAVAILCLLLSPDKEAAAVFLALGYYPILKPRLDSVRLGVLLKLLLFNGVVLILYGLLMKLFGLEALAAEEQDFGFAGLALLLILGNITFFLLDRLLGLLAKRKWKQ